jgi:hypothetical protein
LMGIQKPDEMTGKSLFQLSCWTRIKFVNQNT